MKWKEEQQFKERWNDIHWLIDKLNELISELNRVSGKIYDNGVFIEVRKIYIVMTEVVYRLEHLIK